MNVEQSFTYPFEDKEWISKLGLGALISMVPILNFAWSGYLVGILRNMMNHVVEPLPAWDDLGKKFSDGLILFVAGLIYALPIVIPLLLPLVVTALSGLSSGIRNMQDIMRSITEAGSVLLLCLSCLVILYGILLSILYPAILVMFAREGTFVSCFKLPEAFALVKNNAAAFFTAWGLSVAASIGVGLIVGFVNLVVGWVPCIGWIVGLVLTLASSIYSMTVYAHLFGQFGRIAYKDNRLVPII